jgi:hypothetical protein
MRRKQGLHCQQKKMYMLSAGCCQTLLTTDASCVIANWRLLCCAQLQLLYSPHKPCGILHW